MENLLAAGPALTGLGLLLVGAVGALIAWRQARTARTKLQLDLYALRHPVYAATREFLSVLTAKSTLAAVDFEAFRAGTAEVAFLFGPEITEYVSEFRQVGQRRMLFRGSNTEWPGIEQMKADEKWLSAQNSELDHNFRPYLLLDERFSQAVPLPKSRIVRND